MGEQKASHTRRQACTCRMVFLAAPLFAVQPCLVLLTCLESGSHPCESVTWGAKCFAHSGMWSAFAGRLFWSRVRASCKCARSIRQRSASAACSSRRTNMLISCRLQASFDTPNWFTHIATNLSRALAYLLPLVPRPVLDSQHSFSLWWALCFHLVYPGLSCLPIPAWNCCGWCALSRLVVTEEGLSIQGFQDLQPMLLSGLRCSCKLHCLNGDHPSPSPFPHHT